MKCWKTIYLPYGIVHESVEKSLIMGWWFKSIGLITKSCDNYKNYTSIKYNLLKLSNGRISVVDVDMYSIVMSFDLLF